MNVAVITILGMVGHTKMDYLVEDNSVKKVLTNKAEEDKAKYTFGKRLIGKFSLKKSRYVNTLPILCELFGANRIIPIYTKSSMNVQKQLLALEKIDDTYLDDTIGYIKDEKDFPVIFEQINTIIGRHEKVIVDITHGFRHLPVLAVISFIIENMRDIHKIQHIFFAKEIVSFKEYEIIDLKEYLDVANIAMALSSFNNNYTVAQQVQCADRQYQDLLEMLSEFSEHILSNSIIELIEAKNSLTERILTTLRELDEKDTQGLKHYLKRIYLHLSRVNALKNLSKEKQLFEMSKLMLQKGYYLNTITLLNEAIGYYCANSFKEYSPEIREFIDSFLESSNVKTPVYELVNQSKLLVKNMDKTAGPYLRTENGLKLTSGQKSSLAKKKKKIKEDLPEKIQQRILSLGLEIEFKQKTVKQATPVKDTILNKLRSTKELHALQNFIVETDNLRNNLAHANSSYRVYEVKEEMEKLLEQFEKLCITEGILQINEI